MTDQLPVYKDMFDVYFVQKLTKISMSRQLLKARFKLNTDFENLE